MEHKLITELSEERLDELLAYTPSFTAENLANIKKRCMQKKASRRISGRRILLVAAIAAVAVALSGIALAASVSFDFGGFYNSLFNNPDVEEKIEVGQTAVSNGLEITLLTAVVDRYQAYFTIEIKDTEGNRLSDSISVVNEYPADWQQAIFTGPVTYNEAENKATLALTVLYGRNIAELGTAPFSIDTILLGRGDELITDNNIQGSWRFEFAVGQAMGNRVLIVYPEDDPVFSKLEVKCSPVMFSINMTAHGAIVNENGEWTRQVEGYDEMTSSEKSDIQDKYINEIMEYFLSFERPYLTLDDGSRIVLEVYSDTFDWLGGSAFCPTNYYDIETIRSITIFGEEYFFSGAP
jgi:hypothetical protein